MTRHAARRSSGINLLSLTVVAAVAGASLMHPMLVVAQAAPAPVVSDTVLQPYAGVVNDDNVYVRSGPGEIFYATTKLNKGAKLTVVAVKKDWLKILPPEGSYCYVARAYVEKRGDGTIGRVTKPDLNVRAGSLLNGLKTTVQTSLAEGDDVKILPDQLQDEYFRIVPPPGAFLYIKKPYVDAVPDVMPAPIVAAAKQPDPISSEPVPPVGSGPAAAAVTPVPVIPVPTTPVASTPTPVAPLPGSQVVVNSAPTPAHTNPQVVAVGLPATPAANPAVAAPPTTNPTVVAANPPSTQPATVAAGPATQPAELSADEKFDAVEADFLDATNLPLEKQPIGPLLSKDPALSKDSTLPGSMRRIVDVRIATLKLRGDAQTQYAQALKIQADAKARQVALRAESDELAERVKAQSVTIYSALGTLRISSLQQAGTTLYRLTDPGSGRTLVYIKSNDSKYTGLVNQFIGVKGDIVEDSNMNLKFIDPTAVDNVDPAKVNTTVTATVIPPSMLPKTATASVVGN